MNNDDSIRRPINPVEHKCPVCDQENIVKANMKSSEPKTVEPAFIDLTANKSYPPFELAIGKLVGKWMVEAWCKKRGLSAMAFDAQKELDELFASQEIPDWLPVSQCDLKPGEAFWGLHDDGLVLAYESGFVEPEFISKSGDITHYMRPIRPYAIPKPPVKVEDDGFEDFFVKKYGNHVRDDLKEKHRETWLASRASITEKGGDGE